MCMLISILTIDYDNLFTKCSSVGCVYAITSNQFLGNPIVRSNIYSVLTISNHKIEPTQLNHDL